MADLYAKNGRRSSDGETMSSRDQESRLGAHLQQEGLPPDRQYAATIDGSRTTRRQCLGQQPFAPSRSAGTATERWDSLCKLSAVGL
jgi:hypothetical protein